MDRLAGDSFLLKFPLAPCQCKAYSFVRASTGMRRSLLFLGEVRCVVSEIFHADLYHLNRIHTRRRNYRTCPACSIPAQCNPPRAPSLPAATKKDSQNLYCKSINYNHILKITPLFLGT